MVKRETQLCVATNTQDVTTHNCFINDSQDCVKDGNGYRPTRLRPEGV